MHAQSQLDLDFPAIEQEGTSCTTHQTKSVSSDDTGKPDCPGDEHDTHDDPHETGG